MPRPFASGSRQAPDPFDQFLESEGFYRKHTARDSSCLFRTISEQMYDTQLHHLTVRRNCVDYMRKYKHLFQRDVDIDIDEYLDEMSKTKTYGTYLELRALAYFYGRNVILFEEYNTGTWMVQNNQFEKVFRVFFTPEKHFDTVYPSDFIRVAAFCQAISYDILYTKVFKLPDVTYAVEQMLHSTTPDEFCPIIEECNGHYLEKIILKDGRSFELDRPENTFCILDDHLKCHFHNINFSQYSLSLHQKINIVPKSDYNSMEISKKIEELLPEKYVSCVRQLLNQGITPFPYKVAKALDPDIYRNIEFDAWSELRKEQRDSRWYTGGTNLQVGVKCLVKLHNSQNAVYNCYIQDMTPEKGPCVVYIEELCEKHIVPFEQLQPLPFDQEQHWTIPYRYQRYMEKCANKGTGKNRGINGKKKYREEYLITNIKESYSKNEEVNLMKNDVEYRLKRFTSFEHFHPIPCDYITMPFTVDAPNPNQDNNNNTNRPSRRNSVTSAISANTNEPSKNDGNKKDQETETEFAQPQDHFTYGSGYPDTYFSYPCENGVMPQNSNALMYNNGIQYYCMYNNPPYPAGNGIVPHGVYMQPPIPCGPQPSNFYPQHFAPIATSTTPIMPTNSSSSNLTVANSGGNNKNIRRNANIPNFGRVNFHAHRSLCTSGSDLPTDMPTLRYFYNLGYDYYHKYIQGSNGDSLGIENIDNDTVGKLSSEFQATVKIENENAGVNATTTTTTATTTTKPDANPNQQSSNTRRFSSRWFNNRNKGGYGRGAANNNNNANNRYSSGEYSKGGNNHNNLSKNNNYSTNNGASSNNNIKSTLPSTTPTSGNISTSIDRTIQTSPVMVNVTNSENLIHDYNQVQVYNASHQPLPPHAYTTSYLPYYPNEVEQTPGMYITQPVVTLPYGVYPSAHPTAPQPLPLAPQQVHNGGGYQGYLTTAPPSSQQPVVPIPPTTATYFTPTNESSPSLISAEPFDNGHYTVMGYSYPPVYYSQTATGAAPIPTQSGGPAPQRFWYPAPQSVANTQSGTVPPNGGSHQINNTQSNCNISR